VGKPNLFGEIFNDYSNNKAEALYSHAEGQGTIASGDYQHVQGRYNKPIIDKAFVIGNGKSESNRSNAYTLDWEGNSNQSGLLIGKDFIGEGNHKLSEKENINNKTNKLDRTNNIDQFPTSHAVINYIDSLFGLEIDN
jgi:hypothetical protein